MIEPSATHYYQPLWTLAGGGCAPIAESARPEARMEKDQSRRAFLRVNVWYEDGELRARAAGLAG